MKEKKRVVFLVLPTVQILDLAGPVQVFGEARALGANYELVFCGPQREVRSAQELCLTALVDFAALELKRTDLLIIPGFHSDRLSTQGLALDNRLLQWLRDGHAARVRFAAKL